MSSLPKSYSTARVLEAVKKINLQLNIETNTNNKMIEMFKATDNDTVRNKLSESFVRQESYREMLSMLCHHFNVKEEDLL